MWHIFHSLDKFFKHACNNCPFTMIITPLSWILHNNNYKHQFDIVQRLLAPLCILCRSFLEKFVVSKNASQFSKLWPKFKKIKKSLKFNFIFNFDPSNIANGLLSSLCLPQTQSLIIHLSIMAANLRWAQSMTVRIKEK